MPIRRSPNGARHPRPQAGRDRPEWLVAINRNAWSQSIGTAGRNHPVCAVREQFFLHTPADGTPEQKSHSRRQKFLRALDWAEQQQLIGIDEIDGVTYLRLTRPDDA